jgi:hypothetical protein
LKRKPNNLNELEDKHINNTYNKLFKSAFRTVAGMPLARFRWSKIQSVYLDLKKNNNNNDDGEKKPLGCIDIVLIGYAVQRF